MTSSSSSIFARRALASAIAMAALSFTGAPAQAAPITLTGTSVAFAFDTTTWATVAGMPALGTVNSSVAGNSLLLDFGQTWGLQTATDGYNSSIVPQTRVGLGWFSLPMQFTASAGQKIDGYRLTIGGTWSDVRDSSASSSNVTYVGAGLRTDGVVMDNPTAAQFTYGDYSAGAESGTFLQSAVLNGGSPPSITGGLTAVAQAGACPLGGSYCFNAPIGRASIFLRTLSVDVLTSPVPEPGTFGLLVAGFAVLGLAIRPSRSQA
jgi:PEP-CTERM motif